MYKDPPFMGLFIDDCYLLCNFLPSLFSHHVSPMTAFKTIQKQEIHIYNLVCGHVEAYGQDVS